MAVKIENTTFAHFGNVTKLTNGTVDVLVTTDLGPRVIYYGFCGGTNVLAEMTADDFVATPYGDFHPWGGHRLWAAPEAKPRSYWPDNDPVQVEVLGSGSVRFTPSPEVPANLQKSITITLDDDGTQVTVDHDVKNIGLWPVELAPWALTIVNGGGTTILPQEPFAPHTESLLPARPLILWTYTDLSDPRWTWGKKYIRLRSDANFQYPQKIGAGNKRGWAGYLREDQLFIKRFPYIDGANYPDNGCNFETFTNGLFMEVESVAPLAKLEPETSATHTEQWFLFKGVDAGDTEESLDAAISPLVEKTVQ